MGGRFGVLLPRTARFFGARTVRTPAIYTHLKRIRFRDGAPTGNRLPVTWKPFYGTYPELLTSVGRRLNCIMYGCLV